MKKIQVYYTAVLLLLFLGSSSQAVAGNPPGLPAALSQASSFGVVDDLSTKVGRIVINDQSYLLSPTTVVRSTAGKALGGVALLGKGRKVAFKLSPKYVDSKKTQQVTEVWLLPANFKLPDD